MHNPAYVLENAKETPLVLWHTNGSPNLGQKTRTYNNRRLKKENLQNCGLCWPENKNERMWKEVPGPY